MKGYCFLTLSIAEGRPGSDTFEINCAQLTNTLKTNAIYSFELSKDQIFDDDGDPLWDIGKITLLDRKPDSSKSTSVVNRVYEPVGKIQFLKDKEIPLPRLKEFLDVNKTDYDEFERDQSMPFAIVKVRHLVAIEEVADKNQKKKQRLFLDFDDDHRNENLLNKDYRWIHYWKQIPEGQKWGRQEQLQQLMNQPGKSLYLILRRFAFSESNRKYWISGMHWL